MKTFHTVALSLLAAVSFPSALSFVAHAPARHVSTKWSPCQAASTIRPFSSSSCQQASLLWMTKTESNQELKTGKVSWFNAFRGFGFITIDGGEGDVYVHQSNINMDGFRKLEDGAAVQFRIGIDDSERGAGKAYAYDVTSLDSATTVKSARVVDNTESDDVQIVNNEKASDVEEALEVEETNEVEETISEVDDIVDSNVPAVDEPATTQAPTPAPVDIIDEPLDEGEKAFNILVSLGMVEQTPDPDDTPDPDELAPHTSV